MPTKNRYGFTIPDNIQARMNELPRTVSLTPFMVHALDKILEELQKNPALKPENFSIRVIEQLKLIPDKKPKKKA